MFFLYLNILPIHPVLNYRESEGISYPKDVSCIVYNPLFQNNIFFPLNRFYLLNKFKVFFTIKKFKNPPEKKKKKIYVPDCNIIPMLKISTFTLSYKNNIRYGK